MSSVQVVAVGVVHSALVKVLGSAVMLVARIRKYVLVLEIGSFCIRMMPGVWRALQIVKLPFLLLSLLVTAFSFPE